MVGRLLVPGRVRAHLGAVVTGVDKDLATLLPSECPNCGRLHAGYDFNANPGPVQAELSRLREQLNAARIGCAFGCGPYPEDSIHVGAGIGLVPACPIHGWVAPMLDARDDAIKAAEARCARLQQALREIEVVMTTGDEGGWRDPVKIAREALAGPDTPADDEPCSCCDGEGCAYCTPADSQPEEPTT